MRFMRFRKRITEMPQIPTPMKTYADVMECLLGLRCGWGQHMIDEDKFWRTNRHLCRWMSE